MNFDQDIQLRIFFLEKLKFGTYLLIFSFIHVFDLSASILFELVLISIFIDSMFLEFLIIC